MSCRNALSLVLSVAAVGAVGLALGIRLGPPRPYPGAGGDPASHPAIGDLPPADLGVVRPGSESIFALQVSNPFAHEITIVGAADRCGEDGCIQADGLPLAVPASGSAPVTVRYRATNRPGPFSLKYTLYINAGAMREVRVEIFGSVMTAG